MSLTHGDVPLRPDSPISRPPPTETLAGARPRAIRRSRALPLLVSALALVASLAGLFVGDLYTDGPATAEMLRGWDLVTALAVPLLVLASARAGKGSPAGELLVTTWLAYLAYTYAYYVFGTGFNDLFLLHTVILGLSVVALTLTPRHLDVDAIAAMFRPGTHVRWIAGVLAALALGLGGMWVYHSLHNALTGVVPAGSQLVESDTVVHLGMALDLSLLVPLYGAAALLMWRRHAVGFVLATVSLVAGLLHQASYVVAMPFQAAANVPGAVRYDPAEPVIIAVYLVGIVLLLHGARRARLTE